MLWICASGNSWIENENDEVLPETELQSRAIQPGGPTRRVAMATEPQIMEVTRFGQWPWQLLGVGRVCRPGEGRGRAGRVGAAWAFLCAGVCVCISVRDSAAAVDVATSAQTGWPGEFLPRLKLKTRWSACAGKGRTALRCICQILPGQAR